MIKGNKEIINTEIYYEVRKQHIYNIEGWKVFCKIAQRNPYVRKMLYEKYEGRCQFCGRVLKPNWVLYHKSYDCECISPEKIITVPHPTPSCPNGKIKVPDCENCSRVEECTKNLSPVCKCCSRDMSISRVSMMYDLG